MAEPPDQMPAAGRGHLRASHADREQAVETLKAAFIQGRLDRDEFDLRMGQALASRTYAELAAVTADLPTGLAAAKPLQPARAQDGQPVPRPGRWIAVATAANAAIWAYLLFLSPHGGDNPSFPPLVSLGVIIFVMTLLCSVATKIELRREKRSGGQSSRRPGAGGQGPQRLPSADPGRQRPPADPGPQHTEAARSRSWPGSRSVRRWRDRGLPAGQRPAVTHTA